MRTSSRHIDVRPRGLEADARRGQILEGAIHLFGERPDDDVGTNDITQEAGVTRDLLHHYFGTKHGLCDEAVKRMPEVTRIDMAAAQMASAGRSRAPIKRRADLDESVGEVTP